MFSTTWEVSRIKRYSVFFLKSDERSFSRLLCIP